MMATMTQQFATKSTLFEAIELINSGRIGEAETLCRAAVKRNPKDVNMTALLGATLFKAGQNDEAEKYLRISTELAPNFAKPWSDLGQLLVETRRPKPALEVLEKAVELNPEEGDAWFNLGKARAMLGMGLADSEPSAGGLVTGTVLSLIGLAALGTDALIQIDRVDLAQ